MNLKKDALKTALVGGWTTKTDERVCFFGTCDELSSYIMDLSNYLNDEIKNDLITIVPVLSKIMGIVAGTNVEFKEEDVLPLLAIIEKYKTSPKVLDHFVLPGQNKNSSKCHIVRTVARRCELAYAKVYEKYGGNDYLFEYLNKLSTLFYELALYLEK